MNHHGVGDNDVRRPILGAAGLVVMLLCARVIGRSQKVVASKLNE